MLKCFCKYFLILKGILEKKKSKYSKRAKNSIDQQSEITKKNQKSKIVSFSEIIHEIQKLLIQLKGQKYELVQP